MGRKCHHEMGTNTDVICVKRILWELPIHEKPFHEAALHPGETYFYVFFLGTRPEGRGKGSCSAMVRHYQARAAETNKPIYLEAATAYAWHLYKKLDFQTVGTALIGEGKANLDGTLRKGGPGFRVWGMVWRPDGKYK